MEISWRGIEGHGDGERGPTWRDTSYVGVPISAHPSSKGELLQKAEVNGGVYIPAVDPFHFLCKSPSSPFSCFDLSTTMSAPKTSAAAAEHDDAPANLTYQTSAMDEKFASENVTHVQAASVALASALAAQKPSLLSKSMLKLYFIMAIGYLVSTMNGFGMAVRIPPKQATRI